MSFTAYQPGLCPCGKRAYPKKIAQTIANKRTGKHGSVRHRRGAEYLRIYQCPQSGWWHLTHKHFR